MTVRRSINLLADHDVVATAQGGGAFVKRLQLPAAALLLEHIFYDFDDRPISWGWFIAGSDRLRFTTTVGIQD